MIQSNSKIKDVAFDLMIKFDTLAKPRIQNKLVAWFWNSFFLSHAKTAIYQMNDNELKLILHDGYKELKPIFDKTDLANAINDSRKLNDGKMQNFVEKINYDVMELIPDA